MSRLSRKTSEETSKTYLEEITEGNSKSDIEEIPLNQICERYKNRFIINPKRSEELIESIKAVGLREPLNVVKIEGYVARDNEEDEYLRTMEEYGCKYFISSGHRRFRALISIASGKQIASRRDIIDFYKDTAALKGTEADPYAVLKNDGETTIWYAKCIVVDNFESEEKERRSYSDTNTTGRAGSSSFELVGLAIDNILIESGKDISQIQYIDLQEYIRDKFSVNVPTKTIANNLTIFRGADENLLETIYEGKLTVKDAKVLIPAYKNIDDEEEKEKIISAIWNGKFSVKEYKEREQKPKQSYTREQVKDILQRIKAGWTTVDDEIEKLN
jgi:hypothetical protein